MKPIVRKVYSWWCCASSYGQDVVIGTGDTPLAAIKNCERCARERGFII